MKYTTAYFPSISTFQSMMQQTLIEIDADEHYQKNSYRNRCHLASSQGKILLSVPLKKGKNQQQPIREVLIAYDQNWVDLHLKTLHNNYRRSAFFDYLYPPIYQILKSHPKYLIDLNWASLEFVFKVLHWNPTIAYQIHYTNVAVSPPKSIRLAYPQLFEDKTGFLDDLSIVDLLMCIGPQIKYILPSN